MSLRSKAITLYKNLIRESNNFPSYNFRVYALRKVRDTFRMHKNETNEEKIKALLDEGAKSLQLIKRQALVGQLYAADKLVIENQNG